MILNFDLMKSQNPIKLFPKNISSFNVKINVVAMQNFNDDELCDFVELTRDNNVEVRFIEFMPFLDNGWDERKLIGKEKILEGIKGGTKGSSGRGSGGRGSGGYDLVPVIVGLEETAQIWKVRDKRDKMDGMGGKMESVGSEGGEGGFFAGRIGVISSMTDQFCGGCNRLRLTADGQLKNCLFGSEEFDLRGILRGGRGGKENGSGSAAAPADSSDSDSDLYPAFVAEVQRCLRKKHAKLGGKRDMYELRDEDGKNRAMVGIGG